MRKPFFHKGEIALLILSMLGSRTRARFAPMALVSRVFRKACAGLMLCCSLTQAYYSGNGLGGALAGGIALVGTSLGVTTGGIYTAATGGSTASLIIVGVLMSVSGLAGTGITSSTKKELVVQLKIDHDTYLAGGEATPFLREVYRELQLQTKEYSLQGGDPEHPAIDEQKLTATIDRLAALFDPVNAP